MLKNWKSVTYEVIEKGRPKSGPTVGQLAPTVKFRDMRKKLKKSSLALKPTSNNIKTENLGVITLHSDHNEDECSEASDPRNG